MEMKALFDKDASRVGLRTGWGLSLLFNDTVLFDTGENGEWLLHNMRELDVDIDKIRAVVISHDHWDHTGGLWELLQRKSNVNVYACPGFSAEFKAKVRQSGAGLIENGEPAGIDGDIFVSGEIPFIYKDAHMTEQALIVKSSGNISIITGCAHPGIATIIEKISVRYPDRKINLVAGGFHLKDESAQTVRKVVDTFRKFGVEKVGPTHCTGNEAQRIFKSAYGDGYLEIIVGKTIFV